MSARAVAVVLACAAALGGGLPAAALAADATVGIPGKYFVPSTLQVVVGDTVTWRNSDQDTHDLVAGDGAFASGLLSAGSAFAHTFDTAGTHPYVCTIHASMTGVVDVVPIALSGPKAPPAGGERFTLTGRAPGGVPVVTIEAAPTADGVFVAVGSFPTGPDGSFSAALPARATAAWRAVAGARVSRPIVVPVAPRVTLAVRAHRTASLVVLSVRTHPIRPDESVRLQLYSRERFGWLPAGRAKLDDAGKITFSVRRGLRRLARVVYASNGAEIRSRRIALWRVH